jgi:probable FeS assembly SUF system protein SufT
MHDGPTLELSRDCEAIQVPAGNTVVLPAGTLVEITQNLGGSYTVRALDGLFTISGRDADAMGIEPHDEEAERAARVAAGPVTEEKVWTALKQCFDPEIPLNIVDLGLIYDVAVEQQPSGDARVLVKMTLTAPGCGMGPMIARDAQRKIRSVPGVEEATVDLVWDPPWHQSMITAEGRRVLGLE